MSRVDGQVIMENCQIVFRNFAGKEGQYNAEGNRNFCVLLEPEFAQELEKAGWNVKALRAKEQGDPEQPYLPISVGFGHKPPVVVMITSLGRTTLDEERLELLDWVDIAKVDLIFRPYNWNVGGKSGVKAYLKSIYITIEEDYLSLKYRDVPEIGARGPLALEVSYPDDDNIIDGELVEQLALPSGGKTYE